MHGAIAIAYIGLGLVAAVFVPPSTATELATRAPPGVPPLGMPGGRPGLLELTSTNIQLETVRPDELARDGTTVASTARAQSQFSGGALVVNLSAPPAPAMPTLTRSLGTLWRWTPPDGDFSRRPSIRARLISLNGTVDQLSNSTNHDQAIRATLDLHVPALTSYADSTTWSGDAEIRIAGGDISAPGTYQGRIEISFEAF
ncbi:MAG: hypothetical protein ABI411_08465 [Tahibacter sp.]